jgi:hypothetical protein
MNEPAASSSSAPRQAADPANGAMTTMACSPMDSSSAASSKPTRRPLGRRWMWTLAFGHHADARLEAMLKDDGIVVPDVDQPSLRAAGYFCLGATR